MVSSATINLKAIGRGKRCHVLNLNFVCIYNSDPEALAKFRYAYVIIRGVASQCHFSKKEGTSLSSRWSFKQLKYGLFARKSARNLFVRWSLRLFNTLETVTIYKVSIDNGFLMKRSCGNYRTLYVKHVQLDENTCSIFYVEKHNFIQTF